MSKQTDPQIQYSIKILAAITSVFDPDSDNHISIDELKIDNNLTHFFHALANIAPSMVYGNITGNDVDSLEFNHIANKLVFQYSSITEE